LSVSGRNRTDGRWYNFSTPTFKFYAYSAILDDRPSLQSTPVIRIISVTAKFEEADEITRSGLACILHYDNGIKYVNIEAKPKGIVYI